MNITCVQIRPTFLYMYVARTSHCLNYAKLGPFLNASQYLYGGVVSRPVGKSLDDMTLNVSPSPLCHNFVVSTAAPIMERALPPVTVGTRLSVACYARSIGTPPLPSRIGQTDGCL